MKNIGWEKSVSADAQNQMIGSGAKIGPWKSLTHMHWITDTDWHTCSRFPNREYTRTMLCGNACTEWQKDDFLTFTALLPYYLIALNKVKLTLPLTLCMCIPSILTCHSSTTAIKVSQVEMKRQTQQQSHTVLLNSSFYKSLILNLP